MEPDKIALVGRKERGLGEDCSSSARTVWQCWETDAVLENSHTLRTEKNRKYNDT